MYMYVQVQLTIAPTHLRSNSTNTNVDINHFPHIISFISIRYAHDTLDAIDTRHADFSVDLLKLGPQLRRSALGCAVGEVEDYCV